MQKEQGVVWRCKSQTHWLLSPSRSSTASWMPVEAPDGTAARKVPLCVVTSASTVGLPRESTIWRPTTLRILAGVRFSSSLACGDWRRRQRSTGVARQHAGAAGAPAIEAVPPRAHARGRVWGDTACQPTFRNTHALQQRQLLHGIAAARGRAMWGLDRGPQRTMKDSGSSGLAFTQEFSTASTVCCMPVPYTPLTLPTNR